MGDILLRLGVFAVGAVLMHDVLRWNSAWFLGWYYRHMTRSQSKDTQTLTRIVVGIFATGMLVGAVVWNGPR